eukprot:gnl/TRDRNA2_/TRDRNA2_43789_c0_seq1.p1 gnl/TRDRNA2_/TRDRNA2_43789_c0~~gnl/TRDRNA2_/TRDRNA2_43789_c0_seq1.p1  ORF type:complete len:374 (-),score=82.92 gnl/TRDRNA2_/TRDRNA2_43789_c0_seq1:252-1295(-)
MREVVVQATFFAALLVDVNTVKLNQENLTANNWNALTASKTLFLMFRKPECPVCQADKPGFDEIKEEFEGDKYILVADVDCTQEGHGNGMHLCKLLKIPSVPHFLYGHPKELQVFPGPNLPWAYREKLRSLKPMVSNVEVTDENYKRMTKGKMAFIRFSEGACLGPCERNFQDWLRIVDEYTGNPSVLVADARCDGDATDLCEKFRSQNFPKEYNLWYMKGEPDKLMPSWLVEQNMQLQDVDHEVMLEALYEYDVACFPRYAAQNCPRAEQKQIKAWAMMESEERQELIDEKEVHVRKVDVAYEEAVNAAKEKWDKAFAEREEAIWKVKLENGPHWLLQAVHAQKQA